jgi:hypothetical protein
MFEDWKGEPETDYDEETNEYTITDPDGSWMLTYYSESRVLNFAYNDSQFHTKLPRSVHSQLVSYLNDCLENGFHAIKMKEIQTAGKT